jgi:hypothetical protein
VTLFSNAINALVGVLVRDSEARKGEFNQRPYYRLFAMWMMELLAPEVLPEIVHWQLLITFWYVERVATRTLVGWVDWLD